MSNVINKLADIVSVSSNQSSINQKGVSKMMEGLRLEQEILAKQDIILNCARAQAAKMFHFMAVEEATKEIFQGVIEKILVSKPSELKAGYIKRVAESVTANLCNAKPYGLHSSLEQEFFEEEQRSFTEGYFGMLELYESLPEKISRRFSFEDFHDYLRPAVVKQSNLRQGSPEEKEQRKRRKDLVKYNLRLLKGEEYAGFVQSLEEIVKKNGASA